MNDAEYYQRSCKGKYPYMTRKHAIRDARDVTRKSKESQDVYRCRYCHFWHVGHAATKTLLERKRLRSLKWGRQNMRVDDGED